ncbi:MAG: hypothetical protein ACR2KQ_03905 [Actinomycetota bacterium]
MSRASFNSEDGLGLVGELDSPDDPDAGLNICIAHPKMGGMTAPSLLLSLRAKLVTSD